MKRTGFWHRSSAKGPTLHVVSRTVTAENLEVAMEAMGRRLVWVERSNFQGWACAQCEWTFDPSEIPTGKSIGEMKEKYERQRDEEFKLHVCAENPRETKNPH
jgi:hypothetical protein